MWSCTEGSSEPQLTCNDVNLNYVHVSPQQVLPPAGQSCHHIGSCQPPGSDDVTATHSDDVIAAHSDGVTTHSDDVIAAHSDDVIAAHSDDVIAAHSDDVIPTHSAVSRELQERPSVTSSSSSLPTCPGELQLVPIVYVDADGLPTCYEVVQPVPSLSYLTNSAARTDGVCCCFVFTFP